MRKCSWKRVTGDVQADFAVIVVLHGSLDANSKSDRCHGDGDLSLNLEAHWPRFTATDNDSAKESG